MRYIALATAVLLVTSVTGGAATASAEDNPDPQTITGIVQTLIREPGPGEHADGNDTTKALQVGAETVPLTAGSLATAQDGAKVSVTVAPAADGMKRVLSARTISVAPASTAAAVAATAAAAAAAAADSEVAAATPAPHQLYVALVRPQGSAVPIATDLQVRAMVAKVSSFWSSQTGARSHSALPRLCRCTRLPPTVALRKPPCGTRPDSGCLLRPLPQAITSWWLCLK